MVTRYGKFAANKAQGGATLIEVLVAVAVTSVGLLGMAGLMAVSAKVNYGAYLRAQSGFIAQSLIESMHINPAAVAEGSYDGSYSGASPTNIDCSKHGCSPQERADYDRSRFDHALGTTLPNPKASLKCTGNGTAGSQATVAYDGVCRLEIAWSERALSQNSGTTPQALVWVFQP